MTMLRHYGHSEKFFFFFFIRLFLLFSKWYLGGTQGKERKKRGKFSLFFILHYFNTFFFSTLQLNDTEYSPPSLPSLLFFHFLSFFCFLSLVNRSQNGRLLAVGGGVCDNY